MQRWYARIDGVTEGPISPRRLRDLVTAGSVGPDTPVRIDGGSWIRARRVKGLFAAPAVSSPALRSSPGEAPPASARGIESVTVEGDKIPPVSAGSSARSTASAAPSLPPRPMDRIEVLRRYAIEGGGTKDESEEVILLVVHERSDGWSVSAVPVVIGPLPWQEMVLLRDGLSPPPDDRGRTLGVLEWRILTRRTPVG